MESKGPNLTSRSYYAIIYAILCSQIFINTMAILHRMLLNHCFPSVSSYKPLIVGLCNEKIVGDSLQILKKTLKLNFILRLGTFILFQSSMILSQLHLYQLSQIQTLFVASKLSSRFVSSVFYSTSWSGSTRMDLCLLGSSFHGIDYHLQPHNLS